MALLRMIDEAELSTSMQLKTDWIDGIWKPQVDLLSQFSYLLYLFC